MGILLVTAATVIITVMITLITTIIWTLRGLKICNMEKWATCKYHTNVMCGMKMCK